ncbi:MAG: DNRLRE domain-containing protein, partial [Anaerolineae bacterium]
STFILGDDAADRQYRAVLSFDTSSLPDTAVITSAVIKIKQAAIVGTNPFSTHGSLLADLNTPYFGSLANLEISDFEAPASQLAAATFGVTPASGWYSATVKGLVLPSINLTGTTQFRLRFAKDDNDDLSADQIKFYSGNAASDRPMLIIKYYVP